MNREHHGRYPDSEDGLLDRWARFWFTPTDPFGLHLIRIAIGAVLIVWLASLASEAGAFFGLQGWFDQRAYLEASRLPAETPKPTSWSLLYLFGTSATATQAMYCLSLAVLLLFTLGVLPRITAVLTWLVVASFTANPAFDNEVEAIFQFSTLYLAVGYLLPARWQDASWLERILGPWRVFPLPTGRTPTVPSLSANIALRLLQIHLAILFVTTGLHKLQMGDWWAGMPHWFKLHPPLELTPEKLRALAPSAGFYLSMLSIFAYATLAWQLTFPLFAFRRGWSRVLLLGGAVVGWIGLQMIYRDPLFGPALLAGCLCYISASEWQVVRDWVNGIVQRNGIRQQSAFENIPVRKQPAAAVAVKGR